jgi:ABC-type Fe3+ transport system substrate-binding protein
MGFVLAAASSVAGAASAGWQEEWERVLQTAKRERKVAVVSSVGSDVRRVLTEPFQAKYGISVDFLGLNGAEMAARLRRERDAGQYLLDVVVHGTTTALTTLKPMQALDPIEPTLILPEVKEPKNWLGGKLWFSDKARYNLIMGLTTRPAFGINSNLVKAEQFKSFKDLLNPKWKGKIIVGRDPAIAGPGQAIFTHFFLHKDLGPDFIRVLTKQELTILRDDRQGLDWVAQGKFLILLGPAETISEEMIRRGVPISLIPPQQLREGGDLSPGPASLVLINRAPHPNAARVYINWLLSKEGQMEYSKGIGLPSLRQDVPTDHLVPWRRPVPGYIETYTEEALQAKEPLLRLLKEVLAR